MDALDLLTVLCAVVVLALAAGFAVLCSQVLRLARELSAATEEFRQASSTALSELDAASCAAVREVERVDELLDVATSIGERLDSATGVTYRAIASPVIKGAALATGTRRAARALGGSRRHGERSAR